jgi:NAD(P)-dependent dehydrogenase (short-subunit alcohol dehydrogenase family)
LGFSVFISGSTDGIGKATALLAATKGYKVVIHGRSATKCEKVVQEIKQSVPNARVDYLVADLSLLSEVNRLGKEITTKIPDLNTLILNAGTFSKKRHITAEGFERTWVVNYLSRFLLVHSLVDLLATNGPSRIIDISGTYHSKGHIHFEDLTLTDTYSLPTANNQSKLANVLFTYRMERELKDREITINTLHPGAVNTGSLLRSDEFGPGTKLFYRLVTPFFQPPQKAAKNVLELAVSPKHEDVSGQYFSGNKKAKSGRKTYDVTLQEKLWNLSLEQIESVREV